MAKDLCLIEGCGEEAQTRGLCGYHYEKGRRDGNLEEIARPKRRPAVERYGERALEMWQAGTPMTHIAQELGTSGPTIRAVLQKLGIENPARHSPRARVRKQSRAQADWIGQLDHLPPLEAVLCAWDSVESDPSVVKAAQGEVRNVMPLLARALDRLVDNSRRSGPSSRP